MGMVVPRLFELIVKKTEVIHMNEETNFVVYEDVVVPKSALLRIERGNRYGSVPGLDDSELADPVELERQVYQQEFGPVLALPVKARSSWIRPVVEESGYVDFGAFGAVDFERLCPFDKMRYKADKLREQLKDLTIRMGLVKERLPCKAKYLVLKYLKMGIIELEHISSFDMLCLARLYLRARRLRDEIWRLEQISEARRQRRLERFWVRDGWWFRQWFCLEAGLFWLWCFGCYCWLCRDVILKLDVVV